jgi:hypothetical protein
MRPSLREAGLEKTGASRIIQNAPYFLTFYQPGVTRREVFSFPLPAAFSPEAFADALEQAPALPQVVACAQARVEPEGVVPA